MDFVSINIGFINKSFEVTESITLNFYY